MAGLGDMFKVGGLPGIAVGVGAVLLAPVLLPVIGRAIRPVAKAAIKTGIYVYREATAQIDSATHSIVEEARNELTTGE